jgi:hypothetical protein
VTSDGVFDHRHQHFRHVGVESEAFGYVDRTIQFDGVRVVVPDFRIGEVESEEIDGLLATDVDDPEVPASWDLGNVIVCPGRNRRVFYDRSWNKFGGLQFCSSIRLTCALHFNGREFRLLAGNLPRQRRALVFGSGTF